MKDASRIAPNGPMDPSDRADFDRLAAEITDPRTQADLERRYWDERRRAHGPCASPACTHRFTSRTPL